MCGCAFDVCFSVYACLCVCAHDALFLYWVWCSTDTEQQGWRETLLTGIDGKLWNGNKASCHYSTNSLSHPLAYARKTAMITDKRANNISQLSLASRLSSYCYERRAWWTEDRFQRLQILPPLNWRLCGAVEKKAFLLNLDFSFFLFCFVLFSRTEPHKSAP